MNANTKLPWHTYVLLLSPRRIQAQLRRIEAAGVVPRVPNLWQLELGVLRMWHRVMTRPETVGMCGHQPVRRSWRAKLLQYRAVRLPFLLAERVIAPLDMSGLASSPDRVIRHLLGAHHEGHQLVYDLQILAHHPGRLDEVRAHAEAIVRGTHPRSQWLRDLVVFDGYHEELLAATEQALTEGVALPSDEASDPDISFHAYLRWCADQPPTPAATLDAWRRGSFSFGPARVEVAA